MVRVKFLVEPEPYAGRPTIRKGSTKDLFTVRIGAVLTPVERTTTLRQPRPAHLVALAPRAVVCVGAAGEAHGPVGLDRGGWGVHPGAELAVEAVHAERRFGKSRVICTGPVTSEIDVFSPAFLAPGASWMTTEHGAPILT